MRLLTSCLTLLVVTLFSCHPGRTGTPNGPGISDHLAPRLMGIYNGHFRNGVATVVLNYISDSIVSGYDLYKGVRRNLNGMVRQNGQQLDLVLKEPGNKPLDGTFYLSLDTASRTITGKWVPQDSSKVHTGLLDLRRWVKDTSGDDPEGPWNSEIGTLTLNDNGTCEFGYAPVVDSNAHALTIWGDYQQKADTFYIEWETNKHLPAQQMKLVRYPFVDGTDSTPTTPTTLRGYGFKFERNLAG